MINKIEWKVPGDTAEWDRNRLQGATIVDTGYCRVEKMKMKSIQPNRGSNMFKYK